MPHSINPKDRVVERSFLVSVPPALWRLGLHYLFMPTKKMALTGVIVAFGLGLAGLAQTEVKPGNPEREKLPDRVLGGREPTSKEIEMGKIMGPMYAALRLRTELANQVYSGTISPEEALRKLRSSTSPSGLKIAAEADFAVAAIDLSTRLAGTGKTEASVLFAKAAEQALDALVKRTPDAQAKDKAGYLQNLAHVRWRFLNQADQAKADIGRAITLQPKDVSLQKTADQLGAPKKETAEQNVKN